MTIEQELGILQAAYGNSINDLARVRAQLKQVEDMLRALADTLAVTREDNPGTTGSGSKPEPPQFYII